MVVYGGGVQKAENWFKSAVFPLRIFGPSQNVIKNGLDLTIDPISF